MPGFRRQRDGRPNSHSAQRFTDHAGDCLLGSDSDSKDDFVAAGDSSQIGGTNLLKYSLEEPASYYWKFYSKARGEWLETERLVLSWPISTKYLDVSTAAVLYLQPSGGSPQPVLVISGVSRQAGPVGPLYARVSKDQITSAKIFSEINASNQWIGSGLATHDLVLVARILNLLSAANITPPLQESAKLLVEQARSRNTRLDAAARKKYQTGVAFSLAKAFLHFL